MNICISALTFNHIMLWGRDRDITCSVTLDVDYKLITMYDNTKTIQYHNLRKSMKGI